jgi:hypothetical protein
MRLQPVISRTLPILATAPRSCFPACGGETPADRAAAPAAPAAAPWNRGRTAKHCGPDRSTRG